MTTLFIADLHLSPDRPGVTGAFLQFLQERCENAEALYILGDLFEAWIGDDDPSPLAGSVIQALRDLTDKGTAVFFQHGNRDFLVGRRFCRDSGAQLLPDEKVIELNGAPVLLMHGDSLCLQDTDYQAFRRKVRRPWYKWVLSHLPLRKRMQIAADWRARSRSESANKAGQIMDVSPEEVDRLMALHGVSTLIHGHTHRPAVHKIDTGGQSAQRMVLGDWGERGWVIEAGEKEPDLQSWPIEQAD